MSARRPRLFLDTNVLLSAVLFGGVPGRVLDAVRDGRVDGVVSLHVISEFIDVLMRPRFGFDEDTATLLAEEVASFSEVVPLMLAAGSWVSDRDDGPVVEAALLGHATHLVTGDAAIHVARTAGIATITPAGAVDVIEAHQEQGR